MINLVEDEKPLPEYSYSDLFDRVGSWIKEGRFGEFTCSQVAFPNEQDKLIYDALGYLDKDVPFEMLDMSDPTIPLFLGPHGYAIFRMALAKKGILTEF